MSDPETPADQTKLTAIEKTYREGNNELPPTALDAAVLAQAHAKKYAGPGRWTSPRWIMGLATAAAALLTVSVYRNIELEADLLRDTSQPGKPMSAPGRIESASDLPSELDGRSLREGAGTAAEAKTYRAATQDPAPEPFAATPQLEAQRPASPRQSRTPETTAVTAAEKSSDADSTFAKKLRSQLGQKSASIGRISNESEESLSTAEVAAQESHRQSDTADTAICLSQFTFPEKSSEHIVRDNWISYRLNGTLHTWRCKESSWAEVPLASDQKQLIPH